MDDGLIPNNSNTFNEVIAIIDNARENAFRAVNRELINMYWNIGKYVSSRVTEGGWGKSVVKDFSDFIQNRYVGIKGFSPQNIWRMKQFYETYRGNEKLSALLREISWTNNLQIMSGKTDAEREFYLTLSVKNNYSSRELKRQMDSGLYERAMVVEYALSRSLSPAMIADYKLHLPDKRILENKLRELAELVEVSDDINNN